MGNTTTLPLPSNIELSGQSIGELTDLLCEAFTAAELEQLVRIHIGDRLYVEYVPEKLPFRDTAFRLLEALERRGTTAVLLRGVIKMRPGRHDVRDAIERLYPSALQPPREARAQVAAVVAGVQAVRARLTDPAVWRLIQASEADLKQVNREIDLLARYKLLHDCLHMVQLKHYRQVADVARRFRTDPLAFGTLDGYLAELRVFATDAREAAEGLPDTASGRDQELNWVTILDDVVTDFRTALDDLNERRAVEAVRKLKGILRVEPFRVNRLLALTAQRVPLHRLIAALDQVAQQVGPDDPAAADLRDGLAGLQGLFPNLMGRVTEHTLWQQVENDLWAAEEALHQATPDALEEFWLVWPAVQQQVETLCSTDPSAEWAATLKRYADAFLAAFPAPPAGGDPVRGRVTFDRYRHEAMFRFYLVDKLLRALCGEVTRIGQPLQDLLEDFTRVRH